MIGLLVTGHGHFATGLGSSLKLIAGEQENVEFVNFEEGHSIEVLKNNLVNALEKLSACDGVLVLSDLPGGSPFKTAVFQSPLDLAEAMIPEGKDSIVRFELTKETEGEFDEDFI